MAKINDKIKDVLLMCVTRVILYERTRQVELNYKVLSRWQIPPYMCFPRDTSTQGYHTTSPLQAFKLIKQTNINDLSNSLAYGIQKQCQCSNVLNQSLRWFHYPS